MIIVTGKLEKNEIVIQIISPIIYMEIIVEKNNSKTALNCEKQFLTFFSSWRQIYNSAPLCGIIISDIIRNGSVRTGVINIYTIILLKLMLLTRYAIFKVFKEGVLIISQH